MTDEERAKDIARQLGAPEHWAFGERLMLQALRAVREEERERAAKVADAWDEGELAGQANAGRGYRENPYRPHLHVADRPGNSGKCETCGLDIRDEIHLRSTPPGGER